MWMNNIYTNKELESITRNLYHLFVSEKDSFNKGFEKYFDISLKLTFGELDTEECIYKLLSNYYRNEFFVKRAIKEKLLNNRDVLYEYPIEESRADIIDIDKLTCYEIKTKYDNLERLDKQINSYSKVFKYVYVVCSRNKLEDAINLIPAFCGIITYNDRKNCSFNTIRKASISTNYDIECLLRCCNKKELKKSFKSIDIDTIISNNANTYIEKRFTDILKNRL